MREWSGTKSEKRRACRVPQTFRWPVPPACGHLGGAGQSGQEGPPGHKRLAVLPGAGQGAGAEAGVQGAGRGGPLTLDLQDLVTEVGLEVEGAVGREHEPEAGEEGRWGAQVTAGKGRPRRTHPPPRGLGDHLQASPWFTVPHSWSRRPDLPSPRLSWRPQNSQSQGKSPSCPSPQQPPLITSPGQLASPLRPAACSQGAEHGQ